MKMKTEINSFRKDFVYDQYSRIVLNFKKYDKITKTKMLEAIYQVYQDYTNIIDICTTRELKFLKKVLLAEQSDEDDLYFDPFDKKYDWEREILHDKFLIFCGIHPRKIYLPEEIKDKIALAVKNTHWKKQKQNDELNEIIVGYCKMQGSAFLHVICQMAAGITGIKEENIWQHMMMNKLFNYYVIIISRDYETIGQKIPIAIYQDYYNIFDELEIERKKQGLGGNKEIDISVYKTLFYNDFDIHNPKIKNFLTELKKLPFYWSECLFDIKAFAMLNIDRTPLKEAFREVPALQNTDLTNFFKVMDAAMDEMPSGALNGFTPNEAKNIKVREIMQNYKRKQEYIKQQNACIGPKEAKVFYKLYFGLLDFTNQFYRIKPEYKIYHNKEINTYEIEEIIEKFWQEKTTIISEFIEANPFNFNQEELNLTREFEKGFQDVFIIAKYELEYTALLHPKGLFMVKGLNGNIDELIPYQSLPYPTKTAIIPFKNYLVYDGILMGFNVKNSVDFVDMVEKDVEGKEKKYYL